MKYPLYRIYLNVSVLVLENYIKAHKYHTLMEKESSAGAIVCRKDPEIKYLLLHYDAGHWDFPKGHIEEGETEIETVQREVQEETSIEDIDVIKAFKQQIGYFYKRDGNLVDKSVVFYLAKTETEQVKISYEHKGFEWLSYDEALEKLTFKNAKDILEKANNFLVKNKTLDEFY